MILKLGDQTVCPVVTIAPTGYTLQAKNAAPSTSSQTISPDTGYYGLSKVTLGAVTSAIDPNIVAGNIKQGVTILGVAGTVQEGGTIQSSKTATPSTSSQTITPDSGYDGLGQVIVNAVTAAIDSNIAAGNIKSGVTILGVQGSLVVQNYYTGSSTPASSLGSNGDIYLQV